MIWFWRIVILFMTLAGLLYWDVASLSVDGRKAGGYPPSDFDTYAKAAADTMAGRSPYALDGWASHPLNYRYHPFFGILFWSLVRLPGELGRILWTWGSLLSWWVALWAWRRLMVRMKGSAGASTGSGWKWLAPAVAYPVLATAYIGNVSLLLTLLVVVASSLALNGQSRLAALACLPMLLTKPWWVIIPCGILALHGSWRQLGRLVGHAVLGYLLCTASGFVLVGRTTWSVFLGDYVQWLATASRLYPLYGQSAMFFTDQNSIRQSLARYVGVSADVFVATTVIQALLVIAFGWRTWRLLRSGVGRTGPVTLMWPLVGFVVASLLTPQFEEFVLGGVAFGLWQMSSVRAVRWSVVPYWAYAYCAPSLWFAAALNRPELAILYDVPLLLIVAGGVLLGGWQETGAALTERGSK